MFFLRKIKVPGLSRGLPRGCVFWDFPPFSLARGKKEDSGNSRKVQNDTGECVFLRFGRRAGPPESAK